MGGRIDVDSDINRGSTFTFEIPFARSPSTTPATLPQVLVVLGDAAFGERIRGIVATLPALPESLVTTRVTTAEAARRAIATDQRRHRALLIDMRSDEGRRAAAPLTADPALAGAGMAIVIDDADDNSADVLPSSCAVVLRESRDAEFAGALDAEHRGTLFREAIIAALQALAALTDPGEDAGAADEQRAPQRPGLRVLVAEDNPVNQKVTRRLLERAGHSVEIVDNGEDALDALDEHTFDAFIVDVNMARLGGLDAVKLYRMGTLGQPRLPIIALSADATADTRRAAKEAGVDIYLTKPVDPRRLLDTLATQCRDDGRAPLSPSPATEETGSPAVEPISAHPRYRQETVPAIDWSAIQTLARYTDSEFVVDTLREYQTNAERLVEEIAEAIRVSDTMVFRDRLHALRGTSGNVAATAMCRLCREYRGITDQRLAEAGPAILKRLRDSLQRFRQEFAEGVGSLRPGRQG